MLLLTEFCVRQQKKAQSKDYEGDLFNYWHVVYMAGNKIKKKYSKSYNIMFLIISEKHGIRKYLVVLFSFKYLFIIIYICMVF